MSAHYDLEFIICDECSQKVLIRDWAYHHYGHGSYFGRILGYARIVRNELGTCHGAQYNLRGWPMYNACQLCFEYLDAAPAHICSMQDAGTSNGMVESGSSDVEFIDPVAMDLHPSLYSQEMQFTLPELSAPPPIDFSPEVMKDANITTLAPRGALSPAETPESLHFTQPEFHADDWSMVTNPTERRKIQNRNAQRKCRTYLAVEQ